MAEHDSKARDSVGTHEHSWWRVAQRRLLGVTPVDAPIQWTPETVVALVLACFCALLANSAGIGGGPFYLPILNIMLGFNLKAATALSHTIVATSALASSVYGFLHTSPTHPDRPLVDLDLVITFVPALLLGVSFGVLFNVLFPEWLQTALLVVLLAVVVWKTAAKGLKQWQQEQNAKKADSEREQLLNGEEAGDGEEEDAGVLHEEAFHRNPSIKRDKDFQVVEPHPDDAEAQRRRIAGTQPGLRGFLARMQIGKLLFVLALWAVYLATELWKARNNRCSTGYFLAYGTQAAVLLVVTATMMWHKARKMEQHRPLMDPELAAILSNNGKGAPIRTLIKVSSIMAFAGACAGLLGIGGALIFNPVLLQLTVNPQVCASTSVLMILFSSSAIAISLGFQGLLNVHYAAVFAPTCFLGSLLGVTIVGRLIKSSGRTSIIVILLTVLITIGAFVTAVFGVIHTVQRYQELGHLPGFSPFCQD
ncbi:hypothetical protein WJX81_007097 [Elliptochloris bilobata]|uniref:Sulfite exporter TauE/SafE family protein n=1 Tax=Elliptochloris bilobata TaxID=381761 RepID=A0AAW1RGG2_9CHLO